MDDAPVDGVAGDDRGDVVSDDSDEVQEDAVDDIVDEVREDQADCE